MDIFSKLAEARIREWQQRPEKEKQAIAEQSESLQLAPLEVQLFDEARSLYTRARASTDPTEASALREAAARIETRIMVLLEESGRPLAAKQFAKMLADERR